MIKNTTSVVHGYGPTCWKKVQHDIEILKSVKSVQEPEIKEKVYMSVE
jgi:hypothetical protein